MLMLCVVFTVSLGSIVFFWFWLAALQELVGHSEALRGLIDTGVMISAGFCGLTRNIPVQSLYKYSRSALHPALSPHPQTHKR